MIGKLLLKIVFKASLPLLAVAGVLTYGLYLKGGDPLSMWSSIANRTVGAIRESGANTIQSVQALAPVGSSSSSQSSTTVYTWVDSKGTTHFGSTPPPGVAAKSMVLKSSPQSSSTAATQASTTHSPTAPASTSLKASPTQAAALPNTHERLPGMAGVKLPVNIQPEDLGLTREDLLNMIGQ